MSFVVGQPGARPGEIGFMAAAAGFAMCGLRGAACAAAAAAPGCCSSCVSMVARVCCGPASSRCAPRVERELSARGDRAGYTGRIVIVTSLALAAAGLTPRLGAGHGERLDRAGCSGGRAAAACWRPGCIARRACAASSRCSPRNRRLVRARAFSLGMLFEILRQGSAFPPNTCSGWRSSAAAT